MGIFSKKKNDDLYSVLRKIDGKRIEYVTERNYETYEETVLGHNGAINCFDDKIVVMCDAHIVFCAKVEGLKFGELMSHDGVTFSGFDIDEGRNRSIVAYYKYYRK
jgi:hypothetical protein